MYNDSASQSPLSWDGDGCAEKGIVMMVRAVNIMLRFSLISLECAL